MPEEKGIEFLRAKLAHKSDRVRKRYNYYNMKTIVRDLSGVMPKQFSWLRPVCGWCSKAVDSVSQRVRFEAFVDDNLDMNSIFDMNSRSILTRSAISSALTTSCSFIYISAGADGYPRLQSIDGGNATGTLDPTTQMLTEGYAVLERNEEGLPKAEAYFTADRTEIYLDGVLADEYDNPAPYALLVPIIYHPDPTRPFGRSRISRACMELTDSAIRTLKRSEVSAEFYSFPQKYILGLDSEAEQYDKWAATISSLLQFDKDQDGDHPVVGQFQQQSMTPYNEQLRTLASMFAGETGLTLDDLGFSTANPSTPDAIRAGHEPLRLTCEAAQEDFQEGLRNAGYLAACLRDNYAYDRSIIYKTRALYKPIFPADAAQLSGMGDAVNKIQQSFPDYFTEQKLHELTGL